MKSPTIVINAYNRPKSIERLLDSLNLAAIESGTDLVFSLEHNAHPAVVNKVEEFAWPHGEKEIIRQEKKLGLIGHFLFCGGLTRKYESIIYLEDDLFVGKNFYKYAQQVLQAYGHEESLAGFSLNALWFNGYLHTPFHPIDDGNACFFLQVPWYQGQVYTARQWAHFEEWFEQRSDIDKDLPIHELFINYQLQDDWFPLKTQYLIETKKFYCFPRIAHCVNFGDEGVHFSKRTDFFQTQLFVGEILPSLLPFNQSLAVYDSFYELLPEKLFILAPHLKNFELELDLNGTKDLKKVKTEYLLTSVRPNQFERSYALDMRPPELNVVYEIEGDHFFLIHRDQIPKITKKQRNLLSTFNYHYRFKLSKVELIKLLINRLFKP